MLAAYFSFQLRGTTGSRYEIGTANQPTCFEDESRSIQSYLLTFISRHRLRFIRVICVILSTLLEAINLDEYEPAERLSNTESSGVRRSLGNLFPSYPEFLYQPNELKPGKSSLRFHPFRYNRSTGDNNFHLSQPIDRIFPPGFFFFFLRRRPTIRGWTIT